MGLICALGVEGVGAASLESDALGFLGLHLWALHVCFCLALLFCLPFPLSSEHFISFIVGHCDLGAWNHKAFCLYFFEIARRLCYDCTACVCVCV